MKTKRKIVCFSDTHGSWTNLSIPECDILVGTGDFTGRGSWMETNQFLVWLGRQPAKHVILVPGNHDLDIEMNPEIYQRKHLPKNTHLLINSGVKLLKLSFWGSPYTPEFNNWAFMRPKHEMKEVWSQIPKKVDFLLTHGPAFGILDKNYYGDHCGCMYLREALADRKPNYHIFGHIHHSSGADTKTLPGVAAVNCSVLNDQYQSSFEPKVIYI